MIVTGDRVARFVGSHLDTIICPPFTAMGLERNGQIICGAVFNVYTGPDIEMTVAGHGWTRGLINSIGDYVFGQLGCIRMQVTTEQESVAVLAERIGAQREGILRNKYGEGRNGIALGILAREYGLGLKDK